MNNGRQWCPSVLDYAIEKGLDLRIPEVVEFTWPLLLLGVRLAEKNFCALKTSNANFGSEEIVNAKSVTLKMRLVKNVEISR